MSVKIISALALTIALVLMYDISSSFYKELKWSQYMGYTKYFLKKIAPLAIILVIIYAAVITTSIILLCV